MDIFLRDNESSVQKVWVTLYICAETRSVVLDLDYYLELQTIIFEVEQIINNRPITYSYDDAEETCLTSFALWKIVKL